MPRIIFQRHTHPDVDLKRCYGWSDIALRSEYLDQDLRAVQSQYDALFPIDKIKQLYSSPLQRCAILAQDLLPRSAACEIIFDDRLKELNFGEWEMMLWDDIYKLDGSRVWFDDFINTSTPSGESFIDLLHRTESFIDMLRVRGEDALVVTHSGVIRAAMVALGLCELSATFDGEVEYGGLIEVRL